ncbi:MAG: DNA adenine methylase [Acidithiobacillus sp.]|nr:DNA adenine methylase [Acidithiobacillus sp.]
MTLVVGQHPPLGAFFNATPFPWLGGKTALAPRIIPYFPPHALYVEPYGGAANVLLNKNPAKVEVYNDASSLLVNFFRVLRDDEQKAALMHKLECTLYAREEYALALELLEDDDPVLRAWAFFVAQCQGISGAGSMDGNTASNWGYSRVSDRPRIFSDHVEKLHAIAHRFRQVQVEHDDGVSVIQRWDSPDALFYVDPPYVDETRSDKSGRARYRDEMGDGGHQSLIEALLNLQGGAVLSGYRSDHYKPLEEQGWERIQFTARADSVARVRGHDIAGTKKDRERVECLWLSPSVAAWHRQGSLFGCLLDTTADSPQEVAS